MKKIVPNRKLKLIFQLNLIFQPKVYAMLHINTFIKPSKFPLKVSGVLLNMNTFSKPTKILMGERYVPRLFWFLDFLYYPL